MATSKGNRVELQTFMNYGKSDVIGYKTEESDSKKYVNFIWCTRDSELQADKDNGNKVRWTSN